MCAACVQHAFVDAASVAVVFLWSLTSVPASIVHASGGWPLTAVLSTGALLVMLLMLLVCHWLFIGLC